MSNKTGINTRTLLDLQKFIACGRVSKEGVMDNLQKMNLKMIASSNNYSARAGLVFKSNDCLRTGSPGIFIL